MHKIMMISEKALCQPVAQFKAITGLDEKDQTKPFQKELVGIMLSSYKNTKKDAKELKVK